MIRDILLIGHRQAFTWVDEWCGESLPFPKATNPAGVPYPHAPAPAHCLLPCTPGTALGKAWPKQHCGQTIQNSHHWGHHWGQYSFLPSRQREGLCLQRVPASGHSPKLGSQYSYSSACTYTLAHTSGPHAHGVPLYPLHGSASPACTICLFVPSPWNPAATLLFLPAPLPQPLSPPLCAAQWGCRTQGWHLEGLGDAGVARGGCDPACARQA